MSGPKVKQLPFQEQQTQQTRVEDTPDIQAARDFEVNNQILDAATQAEYDQAHEENERALNGAYAGGIPLGARLAAGMRFEREAGQNRGLALAAGQDALNQVKLQQKLAVAGLTRGENSTMQRSGYNSQIAGGNGALASGIGAAGAVTAAAMPAILAA